MKDNPTLFYSEVAEKSTDPKLRSNGLDPAPQNLYESHNKKEALRSSHNHDNQNGAGDDEFNYKYHNSDDSEVPFEPDNLSYDAEFEEYTSKIPYALVTEEGASFTEPQVMIPQSFRSVEDIFAPDGIIAASFSDYKMRPGQLAMAKLCADTFADGKIAIAEAGTGTGKTFAYLVPALLGGGVTVISTGSKALQDQIVNKDLPVLLKVLGLKNLPYTVLKGFSNYLCLNCYQRNLARIPREYHEEIKKIIEQAYRTLDDPLPQNSSFGEVNSRLPPKITALITCEPTFCVRGRCRYADECFPFKARMALTRSKVIVLNHAIFMASLSGGVEVPGSGPSSGMSWLLPNYNHLILDEAHTVVDYARNAFSEFFTEEEVEHFHQTLVKRLRDDNFPCRNAFAELVVQISVAMQALRFYLLETIGTGHVNILELKYLDSDEITGCKTVNQKFRDLTVQLYLLLKQEQKLVKENAELLPELFDKIALRINSAVTALIHAMNVDKTPDNMDDGDIPAQESVAIVSVSRWGFEFQVIPLEVATQFKNETTHIQNFKAGIVLTSATLSVKQSFQKYINELGLAVFKPETQIVSCIFDYGKRTRLLLSDTFPPPSEDQNDRIKKILDRLTPVMKEVDGGIFFLTTSYAALDEAYKLIKQQFKERLVLCQGGDDSNTILMKRFLEDGRAILIGTSSFWAGVDAPGKALSMVIIDKLPFSSPGDPLFKARCDFCERKGGRAFIQIAIPEAVIELKQGVGRLIRKESDYGVLVICDPRLVTMSYGQIFLKSLPQMPVVNQEEELIAFLKNFKEN